SWEESQRRPRHRLRWFGQSTYHRLVVGGDALDDRSDAGVTPVEPDSTPQAGPPAYSSAPPEPPPPPEPPEPPEEAHAGAPVPATSRTPEPDPAPEPDAAPQPGAILQSGAAPQPGAEVYWHKPDSDDRTAPDSPSSYEQPGSEYEQPGYEAAYPEAAYP